MPIFEITPDDIHKLTDTELRELIARLCAADLNRQGLPASAVIWGGSQTAPDGGLDVRVDLPQDSRVIGFVPRPSTGFQVKKPDMPPTKIAEEMRPGGHIRPVIQALAEANGAYVIVSSTGSTADKPWQDRLAAMRHAVRDVAGADRLITDFYDRRRVADWVQQHPGVIAWVRQVSGRPLTGWQPFGPWSCRAEPIEADYLVEDGLRLHFGGEQSDLPVASGLDSLRDKLRQPGCAVRLVGLSGVGKTRLAQALFDGRIGTHPLAPHLAVYGDAGGELQPSPATLLEHFSQQGREVVLIVDNCGPDLHRQLAERCHAPGCRASVLTIEYDIREDLPEGTEVVTLTSEADGVVVALLKRRYPTVSWPDINTIVRLSEGNTRIALALAQAAKNDGSLARLRDDQIFDRLFWQNQHKDDRLLKAACACALVYSFSVEASDHQTHELAPLAALAKQDEDEVYAHVQTLLTRGLVQQRGIWRAVLPHALANRLAKQALDAARPGVVIQQLLNQSTPRLAKSLSRRLGDLHDCQGAQTIVRTWLTPPDGLLSHVNRLNEIRKAMFRNIAPVLPAHTLAALEQAAETSEMSWGSEQVYLLEHLAYDAALFERAVMLLATILKTVTWNGSTGSLNHVLLTLFSQHHSGTQANASQRLRVIQAWAHSDDEHLQKLAVESLRSMLQPYRIGVVDSSGFGSRSRSSGYRHPDEQAMVDWYLASFTLVLQLAEDTPAMTEALRSLVATLLPALLNRQRPKPVQTAAAELFRQLSKSRFWRGGWVAACTASRHRTDQLDPDILAELVTLTNESRPKTLRDRIDVWVLGADWGASDVIALLEEDGASTGMQLETHLNAIAEEILQQPEGATTLWPTLLAGGGGAWQLGRGLALHAKDPRVLWVQLANSLEQVPRGQRDVSLLRGFLSKVWEDAPTLAQELLDASMLHPQLQPFIPFLHATAQLDLRGVARLISALGSGHSEPWSYRQLAVADLTQSLPDGALAQLLKALAKAPEGPGIAIEILANHWAPQRRSQRPHPDECLLTTGCELLTAADFSRRRNHAEQIIAKVCLTSPAGEIFATQLSTKIRADIQSGKIFGFEDQGMLRLLFEHQPLKALDSLFGQSAVDRLGFDDISDEMDHTCAMDAIPAEVLVNWCWQEPDEHFPLAATLIAFATPAGDDKQLAWAPQARALLMAAPSPERVLGIFIERFNPTGGWSGSLAAVLQKNASLLDRLDGLVPDTLQPFIAQAKAELARAIQARFVEEARRERRERERFE